MSVPPSSGSRGNWTRSNSPISPVRAGERVTIVHGPGPDGTTRTPGTVVCPVVAGHRRQSPFNTAGQVAIHTDHATDPDAFLWVDPMFVDRGQVTVGYRHRAGDPDTARLAAEAVEARLTEHQWAVLDALVDAGRAGLIDAEHEARNGLIRTSAGKRRKELERLGLCTPTDMRRPTDRNALATVHRVTARGLAVHQQHRQGAA